MKSPFKFLDSYTLEDRADFFGRDQEISELYRRVFESRMLLVYGISGTGKSSLINCGLASRFDESDWLPLNIRRGSNIIESLNDSVNKHSLTPLKKNQSISGKLQSVYLDHFKPVFLIFDQFEELFIFGSEEEKKEFIKLIKEIIDSKIQSRVVFVIREEFLAGITEFEYDLPEIFSNRYRVEKMKRANAILAVEGPCKVHNISTEEGFSEELIDKLCPAGNEIELTYLQIYLDRIFRIAAKEKEEVKALQFSKELLAKAGSVSDLLGQFLEEQTEKFDDPETGMTILKSFVSVQGTKKQMTESEIRDSIAAFGTKSAEKELTKYLERFVELRILRERDESGHFELRHDALAAKIFEKFTLLEKELLEVRLFIENALLAFNARKTYLSGEDLDYLSTYEKRLFLPATLSKFVEDSKEKLHSQQRALRRLTTLVAIIFLVIAGAGIRYYLNQKDYSQNKELMMLALLQEKVDPQTCINTAFKIREKDTLSTVVQGIILNSFYKMLQEKLSAEDASVPEEFRPLDIPVKGTILSMYLNKCGTHIFGWTNCMEVFVNKVNDSNVTSFIVENEILTVEISPDSKYFAVVYRNSSGDVYTTDGKKLFEFKTTVNNLMNNRLVRFFPSKKYFMAAVESNKAVIYDSTGTVLFDLIGHTGRVNSLDISSDSRFIVTASCDKSSLIWNFNHKTNQFSPYDTLIRYKDKSRYFDHPDSIIGPNDTIWSCEFNSTGKYILTASADSMLNIWNLNGELRNEFLIFAMNSSKGIQSYWPLYGRISFWATGVIKSDIQNNYLSVYYKKAYDATFAANETAIIASNYSYNTNQDGIEPGLFCTHVMYFDGRSWASEDDALSINPYVLTAQNQSVSEPIQQIELLEISSNRQLFASVSEHDTEITIIASDGYRVINISGSYPLFSKDGKYLFYMYENSIRHLPINIMEIYNIVIGKKLFGNPEKGSDIWKVL